VRIRCLSALAIILAVGWLASVRVAAQTRTAGATTKTAAPTNTWTPPRTSDGQPDLQGVWISKSATPLERPDALAGRPFLTEQEVQEFQARADRLLRDPAADFAGGDTLFLGVLANPEHFKNPNATGGSDGMVERRIENRTSLIVDPPDGKIPQYTPEGRQRNAAAVAAALRSDPGGPEDLSNARRCLTYGVPRLGNNGTGPYSYSEVLQTSGYVILNLEFYHEARIIPLDDRPHLPASIRQIDGDSRGRWEGNTLVVDTTNFSPKSMFLGSAENLHLIERWTPVAPDAMTYEITLSDPTTWVTSWTAVIRLTKTSDSLFEAACHEGNYYSMQDALLFGRAGDKRPK
jgi:hypothetical protein